MPEPEDSPESNKNKQEDFDKEVIHRARKLVAAGAALAAATTLAVTASQPNRSARPEAKPAVAADVRPHVTFLKGAVDPSVDKVITGPIDSPIEGGQKLLYIAEHTDPLKVNMNYIAYGMTMAIRAGNEPLKLYHAPFGVEKFMPKKPDPNNDGMANALDVPPHHWLLWKNPGSIAISPEVETVYAGNEENNKEKYFFTVDQAYEHQAQYYSPNGRQVQLLEAVVSGQGGLEVNGVPVKDSSIISVVTDAEWEAIQKQQGLELTPNPPTSGH
jgi:hypothetical protein